MTLTAYEFISLLNFEHNLKQFHTRDKEKIKRKIVEMLSHNPYRYEMLIGAIRISGLNIEGLRRMKVGVSGFKGGAYVLYRVCEECKKNGYMVKTGTPCEFCDDEKNRHIVLFDVNPRSVDYGR